MRHQLADPLAKLTESDALTGERSHAAAAGVPAADDDVQIFVFQLSKHGRENFFIMLQVAIHNSQVGGARSHHSLDAGRRQSAPIDALSYANLGVALRKMPSYGHGSIVGLVI